MNKKVHIIISSVGAAILCGAIIASNLMLNKYSGVLKPLFGSTSRSHTTVNYEGIDPYYYKDENKDNLQNDLDSLGNNVAEEGIVVLDKGNMPYNTSSKLNLFSKSSVDFVFGGTGSGAAVGELSLKVALESSGFSVNNKLWDFYNSGAGKDYHRGVGSINYGDSDDFAINEVPVSKITSDSGVVNSFSDNDIGVFVLSRTGGEGNDLARGMFEYVDTSKDMNAGLRGSNSTADKYRSYLEPDSIELDVMRYINDNEKFKDFILIVNCNNAMELDFVKDFPKISTIIQIPATGQTGLKKLGEILKGTVASSGRLADTFVKDSFAIPSSQNIGDFEYLLNGNKIDNFLGMNSFAGLYYMDYDESIYVGYRYFETRYADLYLNSATSEAGEDGWTYENNVIYPFGYGDSLAQFEYSNFSLTTLEDQYKISVDVKNVSSIPAKHAVELYVSAPFGEYEKTNNIEKSAIDLVDFAKTKTLSQNQTETVEFIVSKDQLLTYNQKDGMYYLPGGNYYFTIGRDSHSAINNVLAKMGKTGLVPSPSEIVAGDTSVCDSVSIAQDLTSYTSLATNQFDFADERTYDANHKYLSRQQWKTTYPKINGVVSNIHSIHSERTETSPSGSVGSFEYTKEIPAKVLSDAKNFETLSPSNIEIEDVLWGKSTNLEAIDLRGLDITDPRYDEVVSAISLKDATNLFSLAGYETASVESIRKPRAVDFDGPAGFNAISGHTALGFSYPCSLIIAQTWNKELMHNVGECFGRESLTLDICGWYGPTANVHRSPFGGRNFEYFSEDPILTGEGAKQELNGAATWGLYGYLKHFALNDQETHREKENGVCIFANEQTIREIYLKAFQKAIVDNKVEERYYELERDEKGNIVKQSNGDPKLVEKVTQINACTAIMSSFSHIGGVWAGGCYPLLNTVLRDEWGFKGNVITDYFHNWMMKKETTLFGGGNCILDPQGCHYSISKDDKKSQYFLHESTKGVLYAVVNSNCVNGYIHGVKEIPQFFYYVIIQIAANVVFGLGIAALGVNIYFKASGKKIFKKKEKTKE